MLVVGLIVRTVAVPIVLALVVSGCGRPGGSASAPGPESTGEPAASPSAPLTSVPPGAGDIGGIGAPAAAPGEFGSLAGVVMSGRADLAENGCWYLTGNGDAALLIMPPGTRLAADGTGLITAAGAVIDNGVLVDVSGGFVAIDDLPGGADGRWGNYAAFCDPTNRLVAVADVAEPAVLPADIDPPVLAGQLDAAVFTTDYRCGYGFTTGDAEGRWALRIDVTTPTPPGPGVVILPDDRFDVSVTVGAHLFANHCDDALEWFEPDSRPAAEWSVTSGTFTYPVAPEETCSGGAPVTVTLDGAIVDSPIGAIPLGPIEISNDAFGCFAG